MSQTYKFWYLHKKKCNYSEALGTRLHSAICKEISTYQLNVLYFTANVLPNTVQHSCVTNSQTKEAAKPKALTTSWNNISYDKTTDCSCLQDTQKKKKIGFRHHINAIQYFT